MKASEQGLYSLPPIQFCFFRSLPACPGLPGVLEQSLVKASRVPTPIASPGRARCAKMRLRPLGPHRGLVTQAVVVSGGEIQEEQWGQLGLTRPKSQIRAKLRGHDRRREESPGYNQPRLSQVDATPGDGRRRPATVGIYLTSEGDWFEPSCAHKFSQVSRLWSRVGCSQRVLRPCDQVRVAGWCRGAWRSAELFRAPGGRPLLAFVLTHIGDRLHAANAAARYTRRLAGSPRHP